MTRDVQVATSPIGCVVNLSFISSKREVSRWHHLHFLKSKVWGVGGLLRAKGGERRLVVGVNGGLAGATGGAAGVTAGGSLATGGTAVAATSATGGALSAGSTSGLGELSVDGDEDLLLLGLGLLLSLGLGLADEELLGVLALELGALGLLRDLTGLLLAEVAREGRLSPLGEVLVEGLGVVLGLSLLGLLLRGGGVGDGVLLTLVLGGQLSLALVVVPGLGGLLLAGGGGSAATGTTTGTLAATGSAGGARAGAGVGAVLTGALGVAVTALVLLPRGG